MKIVASDVVAVSVFGHQRVVALLLADVTLYASVVVMMVMLLHQACYVCCREAAEELL